MSSLHLNWNKKDLAMQSILKRATEYNLWASKKQGDFLLAQDLTLLDQTIENSFPSIRDTIIHIWSAQVGWLSRLQNIESFVYPRDNFNGSTSEAIQLMNDQSKEFNDYVSSLTMEECSENVPIELKHYNTSTELSRAEIIQHCMNHSTYHRGQLITMARQLGMINPPSTDLFFFLLEKKIEK